MAEDDAADTASLGLPANYHFELPKTIQRLKQKGAKRVALQFPEGLLLFAVPIADHIEAAVGCETVVLGDVSYGACCVDDLAAKALGCDFLVHYGHSCLVSIKDCCLPNMMYVFVEIDIDVQHFIDTVTALVPREKRVVCIATIQFVSSMRTAVARLHPGHFEHPIQVPQCKPLSGGELLGCTSPLVDPASTDLVLFLGDGRFHLESFLIANPAVPALQYDPYKKVLTAEAYVHAEMHGLRKAAIEAARGATSVGLIMGTLGRQGNPKVVDRLKRTIEAGGKRTVTQFLMSEIFPSKLAKIADVDCFVQVACPRLSIDWGYAFDRPLLSPYECEVAFGSQPWREVYPMDHYSKAAGRWSVYADPDAPPPPVAVASPPAGAAPSGPEMAW